MKETGAPTAGVAGFGVMPVTVRSGPGVCVTFNLSVAVRLLLPLSSSGTVSVGSTAAETV